MGACLFLDLQDFNLDLDWAELEKLSQVNTGWILSPLLHIWNTQPLIWKHDFMSQ